MGQIAEVIKYEGDNSTFVWKHPLEDFNSLTQLIVHETQEAIFFQNGQALDLFGPGRYTLETQNVPKIGKFLNRTTGDQTPFHCEVYFINKVEQMAIKWGTDTKVQYIEPTYGFPISIGARGEMSLRVEDSRKLLVKLVGTTTNLSQQKLVEVFRVFLMTRVKTYIAQVIKEKKILIFEIDSYLNEFSEDLHKMLIPDFLEYGISLERFFVKDFEKPEGDRQYEKFRDLHFRQYADIAEAKLNQQVDIINAQTSAQKTVIASQAMATKRAQEGYTYQQERGFDVMGDIARNEGSGSDLRNTAMGIGMGFGVGGAFGNAINTISAGTMNGLMDVPSAAQPMSSGLNQGMNQEMNSNGGMMNGGIPGMIQLKEEPQQQTQTSQSQSMPGNPIQPAGQGTIQQGTQPAELSDFQTRIKKLTMARDGGLITEEEFEMKKQQLLSEI